MEIIVIIAALLVIFLLIKTSGLQRDVHETRQQISDLLGRTRDLERKLAEQKHEAIPKAIGTLKDADSLKEAFKKQREELRESALAQVPPPLPVEPVRKEAPADPGQGWKIPSASQKESSPASESQETFSLEKFMGVKLFAWLGGVAMFFGVIFFVKYAFEKNLIPPALRIALGFVTGAGLLGGGLWTHRLVKYRVLAQALCATGVLILYGVTFAAHAIYHFEAFGTVPTFAVMAVITAVAFLTAVRFEALVVAVLGMLGGFLTPILLSTGQDQVFGLFGYIALLDIGLLAVARHRNWRFLTGAAAVGTVMMQIGWFMKFFGSGGYDVGMKTLVPMGISLGFIVLFLMGALLFKKDKNTDTHAVGAVFGLALVAMIFAFVMLGFSEVATRCFLLYGFVLCVQLAVMAMVAGCPRAGAAQVAAAGLVFLHLAFWTGGYLNAGNLVGALTIYLVFGALHSTVQVLLAKRFPDRQSDIPLKMSPWFAPLVLLLMLLPVLWLSPVSMVIWMAILLLDLIAIGLAVVTRSVVSVLASLVLTMVVAAFWLWRGPSQGDFLMPFLAVITGFSAVFSVAGMFLGKLAKDDDGRSSFEIQMASLLPLCSALLPFAMLVLALMHLPVANPSPVFTVALVMTALLAGLAIYGRQGLLVLAALAGTLAVEVVWHLSYFHAASPMLALPWYLGIYALFLIFPFVFRKACAGSAPPWIASALSGVGHFLLVHDLVKQAYPNDFMGLIPAAFAVPALGALFAVLRMFPEMENYQRSRLAWFGGVALLFITLIFPIQFDRQWITVSWAIEGALLIWLYRRVLHPGLLATGLALLAISFVRLTLNPAVFSDYPRSGTAILNWHLYAYGLVAAAQFFGANWFTDSERRFTSFPARGILYACGGILLFVLLNIEIADYFTAPGDRCIAFMFGGNFARDMTYSIAWGLFSLGLLGIGIWARSKQARYAAIGLLAVTLLKLFVHDLAALENVFRIIAAIGVAVIAFVTSFLYQRFFDRTESE